MKLKRTAAACAIQTVAAVLLIVGAATPVWWTSSNGSATYTVGLSQYCCTGCLGPNITNTKKCYTWESASSLSSGTLIEAKAALGFLSIGIMATAATAFLNARTRYGKARQLSQQTLVRLARQTHHVSVVASVIVLIGTCIGLALRGPLTGGNKSLHFSNGYSSILAIVGMVLLPASVSVQRREWQRLRRKAECGACADGHSRPDERLITTVFVAQPPPPQAYGYPPQVMPYATAPPPYNGPVPYNTPAPYNAGAPYATAAPPPYDANALYGAPPPPPGYAVPSAPPAYYGNTTENTSKYPQ